MGPLPKTRIMSPKDAALRAIFVTTGLVALFGALLAPGPMLFAGGVALAVGLGQGFATIRREAELPTTGAALALEHA